MSSQRLPCSGCVEEVPDGEEWLCWACALSSGKPYLHSQTPVSSDTALEAADAEGVAGPPHHKSSRPHLGLHRGGLRVCSRSRLFMTVQLCSVQLVCQAGDQLMVACTAPKASVFRGKAANPGEVFLRAEVAAVTGNTVRLRYLPPKQVGNHPCVDW